MIAVHVLNGPNLNLLGRREPAIDGGTTPSDIERLLRERAEAAGAALTFRRSNHDGLFVDRIQAASREGAGAPTDEAPADRSRPCRRDPRLRSAERSPGIRRDPSGPERRDGSGSPKALNR